MTKPGYLLDEVGLALALTREQDGNRQSVWVSRALTDLAGLDRDEKAAQYRSLLSEDDRDVVDGLFSSCGDEPKTATVQVNRPDGTSLMDRITVRPFALDSVRYWLAFHEDVTDALRATAERARLLSEITASSESLRRVLRVSEVLAPHVTLQNALAELPPLLVPSMARWALARLVDSENDDWLATAAAHAEGSFPLGFERCISVLFPSQMRATQHNEVLYGRRPYVLFDTVDPQYISSILTPEAAAVICGADTGSMLIVPLRTQDEVIGTLVMAKTPSQAPFTEEEIEVSRIIGLRAGMALAHVNSEAAQRHRSVEVQNALLPEMLNAPGVEVVTTYRPSAIHSAVGGDWYDLLPLDEERFAIMIGDVCGHDLRSAGIMARYRFTIRAFLWQGDSPAKALTTMDEILNSEPEFPRLATGLVAVADRSDPDAFRLSYASAAHLPAYVVKPDGELLILDEARSTPVGIPNPSKPRTSKTINLPYGSTIVMITDGVVERRDRLTSEQLDAFADTLRRVPRGSTCQQIHDEVTAFSASRQLEDDICILVARVGVPTRSEGDPTAIASTENGVAVYASTRTPPTTKQPVVSTVLGSLP